ncbi:LSU ribosomal protein L4P [Nannocystis exedens]|uniref:Large ribosomal subunit protein uL4 n=1 Tax=Nannocystis exedens TaxID=54 RepID=A0A1I2GDC0_9BACT|nr:50S ribosomal protein L4 [Nannocystis exedens]PCC70019.1 50S ribosomal protein L4 [Nannocystis exedens]SFF15595.1 LSU ribosomal protein L4P [Nannocystis exedens]
MAKLIVKDLTGAQVGEIDVADAVFAVPVREHLLWEVVRYQRAARRAGTHSTQTRAEVSVTGKKLHKQKGTGGARHGSRRANIFRGGGQVFGPKPRNYAFHVNKKVMASALRTALTVRASKGDLVVIRDLQLEAVKTKTIAQALTALGAPKALVVDAGDNTNLRLSTRNLAAASFLDVRGLNVYDILRFPKLLISETSLRAVEARLSGAKSDAPKEVA